MKSMIGVGMLAIAAMSAAAGSFTWTGGAGDGKWTSPANWSAGSGYPAAGDTATIANAGSSELVINVDAGSDEAPLELAGLTLGAGGAVRLAGNAIRLAGTYHADASATVETALVLGGTDALAVEIAASKTNTFAGVVSGTAGLTKAGSGHLVLMRENTYAGGTTVSEGSLEVQNARALGTSTAPVHLAASGSSHARLYVTRAMTFAYPIDTEAYTPSYWADKTGTPNLWITAAVTFTGAITGQRLAFRAQGIAQGTASGTFDATIDLPDGSIYLFLDGTRAYFKKRVVAKDLDWNNGTNGGHGDVYWYSSENRFERIRFEYKNHHAYADNAFGTNAVCAFGYCEGGRSMIDLASSVDQTIDRLDYSLGSACAVTYDWRHLLGHNVYGASSASAPARLTMRATADNTCDAVYENYLDLVWWPRGDYTYQTFDNGGKGFGRIATMTGRIVVSNGTFVVNGTNAFPNVTGVEVGPGATFRWQSGSGLANGGLASLKSVTVADGGTFAVTTATPAAFAYDKAIWSCATTGKVALPDGTAFEAYRFYVNGASLPAGLYTGADDPDPGEATPIAQLGGHVRLTITIDGSGVNSVNATWTGAGADTKLSTAANWQGGETPAFATGEIRPVVAADDAAGRTVTVDGSYLLNGLLLRGGAATLTADASAANPSILLGRDGLATELDASAAGRTHVLDVPLALQSAQTWNVTNAGECVFLRRPLDRNPYYQSGTLTKTGPGKLTVQPREGCAGGTFSDNVAVRGGYVTLSGKDPLGNAGQVDVYTAESAGSARLVISNLVTSKAISWHSSAAYRTAATYAEGTTNVILGALRYNGSVCNNQIPSGTRVVFGGGYGESGAYVNIGVQGEMVITNKPMTVSTFEGSVEGMLHLYASSNSWEASMHQWCNPSAADNWRKISWQPGPFSMSFHTQDAIVTPGSVCVRDSKWHMNGYDAWIGNLWAGANAVFDSDAGAATLHVNQTGRDDYYFLGTFKGGAGLHKYGARTLEIWTAQSSTGAVSVTAGTLSFTNSGSWATSRSVTVSGTGRLEAWSTKVLGRHTDVHLSDGGTYAFGNDANDVSGVQPVGFLYLDGATKHAPLGNYCAADANGNPVVAGAIPCAHITGKGVLRSCGDGVGTLIYFR